MTEKMGKMEKLPQGPNHHLLCNQLEIIKIVQVEELHNTNCPLDRLCFFNKNDLDEEWGLPQLLLQDLMGNTLHFMVKHLPQLTAGVPF